MNDIPCVNNNITDYKTTNYNTPSCIITDYDTPNSCVITDYDTPNSCVITDYDITSCVITDNDITISCVITDNDITISYVNVDNTNINKEDDLLSDTSTLTDNSDFFQPKLQNKFILNKSDLSMSINLNQEDFTKLINGLSKISDEEKAIIIKSIQTTSVGLYKLEKQKKKESNIWYSDFIKPYYDFIFGKSIHTELFNLWLESNKVFKDNLTANKNFINNISQIQKILNSISFDNSYEKQLTDFKKILEIYIKLRQLNDKSLLIKYYSYINENIMNILKCKKVFYYRSKRSSQIELKIDKKIKRSLRWEKIKNIFTIRIR